MNSREIRESNRLIAEARAKGIEEGKRIGLELLAKQAKASTQEPAWAKRWLRKLAGIVGRGASAVAAQTPSARQRQRAEEEKAEALQRKLDAALKDWKVKFSDLPDWHPTLAAAVKSARTEIDGLPAASRPEALRELVDRALKANDVFEIARSRMQPFRGRLDDGCRTGRLVDGIMVMDPAPPAADPAAIIAGHAEDAAAAILGKLSIKQMQDRITERIAVASHEFEISTLLPPSGRAEGKRDDGKTKAQRVYEHRAAEAKAAARK